MSDAARKARKRNGNRTWVKTTKRPTRPYGRKPVGLGLVTGAEILAALVTRGIA